MHITIRISSAIFDSHTAHFALQMPTQLERQAFWQQAFDYLDRPPAGYEVDGEGTTVGFTVYFG